MNITYIGYKNQVKDANDAQLKEKLITIMLESANINPSKSLRNKGEIPTLSLLEKIMDMLPIKKIKKIREIILIKKCQMLKVLLPQTHRLQI